MKKIITVLFLSIATTAIAGEKSVISCGESRQGGYENAEISLVDDVESTMKFYLRGEALNENEYDIAARDGGWIVTVYGTAGKLDRKFDFSLEKKNVQEYLLEEKGERKIGKAKACNFSS